MCVCVTSGLGRVLHTTSGLGRTLQATKGLGKPLHTTRGLGRELHATRGLDRSLQIRVWREGIRTAQRGLNFLLISISTRQEICLEILQRW